MKQAKAAIQVQRSDSMLMVYEGKVGEHVETSAKKSIAMASKHNRKIQLRFNGISLDVNKRLSVKHVVRTWWHATNAASLRRQNCPAGKTANARRLADVAEKQEQIDELIASLPASKEDSAAWLAKWIPLSDDVGVDGRKTFVSKHLLLLGFMSDEHVGEPGLKSGTASRMMRIEYIAGQVLAMLGAVGFVHPILAKWAQEASASN